MRALWILLAGAALVAAPAVKPPAAPAVPPPALVAAPVTVPVPAAAEQAVAGLVLSPAEQLQIDAVSYVEAQAAALSGHYTFRVLRPPVLPRFASGGKERFEPDHLSRKELGGAFFVSFRMYVDGRAVGLVRVDLEGAWTGKLLRAQMPLPRKAVPDATQFETVDFEGTPPVGALESIPAGYRLRTPVPIGHVLVMQDLETIPVIMAGDQVRAELVSGTLTIAVDALARTSGAVGDKVRLEMPSSHKNVQAVVLGPGEARVQWAGGN